MTTLPTTGSFPTLDSNLIGPPVTQPNTTPISATTSKASTQSTRTPAASAGNPAQRATTDPNDRPTFAQVLDRRSKPDDTTAPSRSPEAQATEPNRNTQDTGNPTDATRQDEADTDTQTPDEATSPDELADSAETPEAQDPESQRSPAQAETTPNNSAPSPSTAPGAPAQPPADTLPQTQPREQPKTRDTANKADGKPQPQPGSGPQAETPNPARGDDTPQLQPKPPQQSQAGDPPPTPDATGNSALNANPGPTTTTQEETGPRARTNITDNAAPEQPSNTAPSEPTPSGPDTPSLRAQAGPENAQKTPDNPQILTESKRQTRELTADDASRAPAERTQEPNAAQQASLNPDGDAQDKPRREQNQPQLRAGISAGSTPAEPGAPRGEAAPSPPTSAPIDTAQAPRPGISAANAPAGAQQATPSGSNLTAAEQKSLHASVARGLNAALNQKGGSLTMRLTPESLGQMRIQMSLHQGKVSVELHTASTTAHRAVTEQISALRGALEARGYQVEKLQTTLNSAALRAGGSEAASSQTGGSSQASQQNAQQNGGNTAGQHRGDGQHAHGDGRSRGSFDQQPQDRGGRRDRGDAYGAASVSQPRGFGDVLTDATGNDAAA